MTWAGMITGFPTDTPESIARDIEIIKKELPLDILEFFFLTPLPGSEDHQVLYRKGVPMDPDMNKYDLEHVTTGHPSMSPEQWKKAYRDAYTRYYSDEHVETILKRAAATGLRMNKVADVMTAFSSAARIEGVHPLQCGIVRRKVRTSRRHGMPIVNPLIFYPVRAVEFVSVVAQWLTVGWRYHSIKKRVLADPAHKTMSTTRRDRRRSRTWSMTNSWRPSPTRSRIPTAPRRGSTLSLRERRVRAIGRLAMIEPKRREGVFGPSPRGVGCNSKSAGNSSTGSSLKPKMGPRKQ